MTNGESGRLAVLEVMVEMLAAQSMMREADPDRALQDYGEVAVMILTQRHTDAEMDDIVPIMVERSRKIQEMIETTRQQMIKESN